jgi:predicted nucleic acid-binding protein
MIVSNSTVLIYLAKIGKIGLLKKLFKKILIPTEVFNEVVIKGKELQHFDALIVEKAVEEGWIEVKDITANDELESFGIDPGEAQAISLAKTLGVPVLLDQTHARIAARALGLKPRGTIFVLAAAMRKKLLTYEEYLDSLEGLVKAGFRMSEEVYLEAVRMGRNLDKIRSKEKKT